MALSLHLIMETQILQARFIRQYQFRENQSCMQAIPDVKLVDLRNIPFPAGHTTPKLFNGYVQKILSLYSTNFDQVLLLDADSQPLKNPESIIQSPYFQAHGNIFWPDFWKEGTSESPGGEVYKWLGLRPPWLEDPQWQCAESGQVFLDKVRYADVMEWVWFLNSHAELLYRHMLGDKDLFEVAFMLAGRHADFTRIPYSPGVPLTLLQKGIRQHSLKRYRFEDESNRYLRVGMIQYDSLADPAFIHRTERTKFANWKNGYPPSLMMPALFLPSYGPDIDAKEKELVWNLNSIPASMAEVGCTCCAKSHGTIAILRRAAARRSNLSIWEKKMLVAAIDFGFSKQGARGVALGHLAGSGEKAPCVWVDRGGDIKKLALFPVVLLGEGFLRPLRAGFEAYEELSVKLGAKFRSTASP